METIPELIVSYLPPQAMTLVVLATVIHMIYVNVKWDKTVTTRYERAIQVIAMINLVVFYALRDVLTGVQLVAYARLTFFWLVCTILYLSHREARRGKQYDAEFNVRAGNGNSKNE